MADRSYTKGRGSQNIRLQDWPAGRVAQLKLAVQKLEDELNKSIASPIDPTEVRTISPRVPKITEFSIRASVTQFQITIIRPRGITDLLHYEIQLSADEVFSDPETIKTPLLTVTKAGFDPDTTRFFRLRCVNSNFDAGPWSETSVKTTPTGKIITETDETIDTATLNTSTYTTIRQTDYVAEGGRVATTFTFNIGTAATGSISKDVVVRFKVLINGVDRLQTTESVIALAGLAVDSSSNQAMTRFVQFDVDDDVTIEYQAIIDPSSDASPPVTTGRIGISQVIEMLE